MECLRNYIGLKDVSDLTESPPSGLYINALPGITTGMLSRIAETEEEGMVWDNVQTVAGARLYTDALVQLKAGYNLSYLLKGEEMALDPEDDCAYEKVICSNKKLFASVWLYLLGNQICIEVLSSSRHNQQTTVDREKYEQLRDFYQVEYEKALKLVINSLCIESKKCLQCGGDIRRVTWLP